MVVCYWRRPFCIRRRPSSPTSNGHDFNPWVDLNGACIGKIWPLFLLTPHACLVHPTLSCLLLHLVAIWGPFFGWRLGTPCQQAQSGTGLMMKGSGLFIPDERGVDVLVHRIALQHFNRLEAGDTVEFSYVGTTKSNRGWFAR